MKLSVKDLQEAIGICDRIVNTDELNFDCSEKGIIISKANNFNKVSYKIKTSAEKCNFTVNESILMGSIKGVKEVELECLDKDQKLKFKAGSKRGLLSTLIYRPIEVLSDDMKKVFNFDKDVKSCMTKLLPKVCIDASPNLPEEEQQLDVLIRSTGKKLKFLCADKYHTGYCEIDYVGKEFNLNISKSYINILSLFSGDFELTKDDNCIYMFNKTLKVCMPQIVCNQYLTFDGYETFLKNLPRKVCSLTGLNLESFSDSLCSSSTVKTNFTDIYVRTKKDGTLDISCESEVGKVDAKVDTTVKGKIDAILVPANTFDIINLIKAKTCDVDMYENFMIFKHNDKDGSYIYISGLSSKI